MSRVVFKRAHGRLVESMQFGPKSQRSNPNEGVDAPPVDDIDAPAGDNVETEEVF